MSEHSALNSILRPGGITTLVQPIVRRAGGGATQLHAVECLSRGPKGTNFEATRVLFDYVRLKGEETLVDRACISTAFQEVSLLPADLPLHVNVHASTLGRDSAFVSFLRGSADKNRIEPLIGARFPFEQAKEAYAHAWGPDSFAKTVIELA